MNSDIEILENFGRLSGFEVINYLALYSVFTVLFGL